MKKLMVSALLLLVATTGMAQEDKGWFITPRVGMNVATMTGADYYGYYENAKDKIGLSMGADVEYRFSRLIGISTGLMYANIGKMVITCVHKGVIHLPILYRISVGSSVLTH